MSDFLILFDLLSPEVVSIRYSLIALSTLVEIISSSSSLEEIKLKVWENCGAWDGGFEIGAWDGENSGAWDGEI